MLATMTRSAPPATPLRASEPPNWPIPIWFARSAELVWAPPLIDCMSTSRPCSLKMPFSNAYHMTQSSALMLLYAATTFLQHGSGVLAAVVAAADGALVAAWVGAALGAVVAAGVPPHATARIARVAMRTPSFRTLTLLRVFSGATA